MSSPSLFLNILLKISLLQQDFQGPPGAILKYDLLSNTQPGLHYPKGPHLGAFVAQTWPPGRVNHELQEYVPWAAVQDPKTNHITITAQKHSTGKITSARLESYKIWSTAQDQDIKRRGYVEVKSTLPAKTNGWNFKGSWPAIWMLGNTNGATWPRCGEIDILETVNGKPDIVMSLHSTHHHGANSQHPPRDPFRLQNVDLSQNPLTAGLEWNIRQDAIDLTWWFSWYDIGSKSWKSDQTTKVLSKYEANNDYNEFLKSFNEEGFSLILNIAEGGDFPNTHDVFIDHKPQYMRIESVKVYRF